MDDERAKDVTIHVSDSALMHLLLAGMESYDVRLYGGKPIKRGKKKPVETAGLLWGYTVQRDDMDHVMVEHVSTDTYATRSYWDVELNDTVIDTKRQIIRDRWPHLLMIGDFHTHPYETHKDAKEVKGWEASPEDIEWQEDRRPDDWKGSCVALILTMAKLERVHGGGIDPRRIGTNVLHWQQLGDCRFWLSAYAVDPDGDRFKMSPDGNGARDNVYLDVPTINGTSARFSSS